MSETRPTPRSILGLIGSYVWAFVLIVLGSVVGGFLVTVAAFSLLPAIAPGIDVAQIVATGAPAEALRGLIGSAYSLTPVSLLYTAWLYLTPLGVWIVALIFLRVWKRSRPILSDLGRKVAGNTGKRFLIGLAIGVVLNGACAIVAILTGCISLTFNGFSIVGLIVMFVAVFIQSSSEELIVRCYLYQRTVKATGSPLAAVLLGAAYFAALHLANPGIAVLPIVNLFLVGILFGLLVWKLDSPWAAFACHTGWNFTQAILLGLPNSGTTVPFSFFGIMPGSVPHAGFAFDPVFGIEGTALASLALVAGCAFIWWLGTKKKVQETDIWADSAEAAPAAEA